MRIFLLISILLLSVHAYTQTKTGTKANPKSSVDMTIKERKKENTGSPRVIAEQDTKEKTAKAKKSFEDFTYFDAYELGITLEEAKIKYEDFFRKTIKRNNDDIETIMTVTEDYDSLRVKESLLAFYIKNARLYGYAGQLYDEEDDKDYSKGNKKVLKIVALMNTVCDFPYKETLVSKNEKGEMVRKLWEKNGKKFFIQHAKFFVLGKHHSNVSIYLMDEKYAFK